MTTFHFVSGTSCTRKERREIRRHVMIGKNAGKTIHRPSRSEALNQKTLEPVTETKLERKIAYNAREKPATSSGSSTPNLRVSTEVRSIPFPAKLTPQYAKIVIDFFKYVADRMYPTHIGVSVKDAKQNWLRIMTTDPHAFHCNVALMQASNALFLYGEQDTRASTLFLAKSIAHVRKLIESPDALSLSTVAIVLSLVTQEQFRMEHEAARVHLDGLVRMIQLRGGLDTLVDSVPILLKVCKTDILFSLEYGNSPIFFRDRMAEIRQAYNLDYVEYDRNPCVLKTEYHVEEAVLRLLVDVFDVCKLFNDRQRPQFVVELSAYQEVLVSISYRLLALKHIYQHSILPTSEVVYQLGLIVFVLTLFLQYGRRRLHRYTRITQLLRSVVELHFMHSDKDQMLWLMVTGGIWMMDGIWALDAYSGDWLPPLIVELARGIGVQTWEEARARINKYPWIHKMQDLPGRRIWERVFVREGNGVGFQRVSSSS